MRTYFYLSCSFSVISTRMFTLDSHSMFLLLQSVLGRMEKVGFDIQIYILKKPHDVTLCSSNITHWNDLIACCSPILLQDCLSSPSLVPWQRVLCLLRVRWTKPSLAFCSSLPPPFCVFPLLECTRQPRRESSAAAPRRERETREEFMAPCGQWKLTDARPVLILHATGPGCCFAGTVWPVLQSEKGLGHFVTQHTPKRLCGVWVMHLVAKLLQNLGIRDVIKRTLFLFWEDTKTQTSCCTKNTKSHKLVESLVQMSLLEIRQN